MREPFRKPIVWGSLLLLCPMLALSDAPSSPSPEPNGGCDRGMQGPSHPSGQPGGPSPRGPGGGGFGFGDDTRPPPFLMNITLTDDQEDKVFAIVHAAAPALREREKAARKARDALHQLVRASSFSDGAAASLAQAQGATESQLALLRIKMEHDVYAVLTPEQQLKITSRDRECDFRGRGGPFQDGNHGGNRPPH